MNKYESAIQDYEACRRKIKRLTAAIREAGYAPFDEYGNGGQQLCAGIKGKQTCLERLWEEVKAAAEFDDQPEHVELCASCAEVERLIPQRREAKHKFGIAKRRLSRLGAGLLELPK